MTPQKQGLFVTIQEEEWPPPAKSILGWWANCLLGIVPEVKRVCTVENYTTKPIMVDYWGFKFLEVPAMDWRKFPITKES